MMDDYMQKLDDIPLCGIKKTYWSQFFKAFQESSTDVQTRNALNRLRQRAQQENGDLTAQYQSILSIIEALETLLDAQ